MARARKTLRHVRTIKSIRTVTKTMEMVATARFKTAHEHAVSTRPYVDRMAVLVSDLVARGGLAQCRHPLLLESPATSEVLMVITANRGLCGGYNDGVLRIATERRQQLLEHGYQVRLHVFGKRGVQHMRFAGLEMEKAHVEADYILAYPKVRDLADGLMEEFTAGRIGGLEVAYTQFISAGRQRPAVAQVLPLTELSAPPRLAAAPTRAERPSYELLPSPAQVFDRLLPLMVRLKLYQCFLDAAVSEQIMRARAMTAATDNADEMIRDLTIQYNRQRQSQITTELAEIMGGATGLQEAK